MEYKNERVGEVVEKIKEIELLFTERKKGQEFRAIINTLAYCFPEDMQTIKSVYLPKEEVKAKTSGARISRKKPKARSSKEIDSGCADCPDSNTIGSGFERTGGGIASGKRGARIIGGGRAKRSSPQNKDFSSPQSVLVAFESDPELMKMFCRAQRINIGNASKAETIANKIASHFKQEEE